MFSWLSASWTLWQPAVECNNITNVRVRFKLICCWQIRIGRERRMRPEASFRGLGQDMYDKSIDDWSLGL